MVRGYQKRIIYLKNTRSKLFDEAYFVVKEDNTAKRAPHEELVEEANRIIDENYINEEKSVKGVRGKARVKGFLRSLSALLCVTAIPFILGVAICLIIVL